MYDFFFYKFDTVLYQFLEIGTSDRTFMVRDQQLKRLAFSLFPPFHFSFPVPLKDRVYLIFITRLPYSEFE